MKALVAVLVVFTLSGCTNLSRQNHLSIQDKNADISDSFCGYASAEWVQFGTGNLASVADQHITVEFCATAYYSKVVASGFVIPVLPVDGRVTTRKRWIQIKNTHPSNDIIIKSDFALSARDLTELTFCRQRYPDNDCPMLGDIEGGAIRLKQNESVWVSLPERDLYTVHLHSGASIYKFTFIEAQGYSWWMVTV